MRPFAALAAGLLLAFAGRLDAQPAAGELGFDVPAGYVRHQKDGIVILAPATPDEHACMYGVAGRHGATGPLEAAAEAAVSQVVVPGWSRLDDRHAAMRGTSPAGWPYAWWRAAFATQANGQRQAVNAMALVLPAGPDQVHVVWGMGSISRCLLDDATFEQLFQSLRPTGWASDGGRAFVQALAGSWRFNAGSGVGLQQLTFGPDGRYARDLSSRTRLGVSERTSATASGGRFTVRDGELVLVPDQRPGDPDRYGVRVFEEWMPGGWRRSLTLTDRRTTPPGVTQLYRIEP
jgi:hypothetical protein